MYKFQGGTQLSDCFIGFYGFERPVTVIVKHFWPKKFEINFCAVTCFFMVMF